MDVGSLLNSLSQFECPIKAVKPIGKALEEAIEIAGEEAVVLVTGSIFVAATARIAWFENMQRTNEDRT